jgi:hypothetical protein
MLSVLFLIDCAFSGLITPVFSAWAVTFAAEVSMA